MRINSIKIYNISSYTGECNFDFNLSDGKSVILIGGQNGTGKTSLFTALKLALYGHLNFNYQSANSQYLAKVKELISHDAFASSEVKAFIEIVIEIPNEREFIKYIIKRAWIFNSQRLHETICIFKGNEKLSESQILFFQNYLYTILPPNLFDYFFFDGEQIADFFATNNYSTYIKNALLTLCNFDTFEIIRKFCNGYINSSDIQNDANNKASTYEVVINKIDFLKNEQLALEQRIVSLESDISTIVLRKVELENQFKNSGGLTESEKDELLKVSRELEREKSESGVAIKTYVEGKMPFIIASSISKDLKEQLEKEVEVKKYLALQEKLNSPKISEAIKSAMGKFNLTIESDVIAELAQSIGCAVKPDVDIENFLFLHDLSKEQQEKVNTFLKLIESFKANTILKKITERDRATQRTIAINRKLREAMSDLDATEFSQRLSELTSTQFELQKQLECATVEKDAAKIEIDTLEKEQKVLYEKLKEQAKNRNVYELTKKIGTSLDDMIKDLTVNKFKQIEAEMLTMIKKIMRKDSFIDLVELDDGFNIAIYKEQTYQFSELENLIRNVGQDELAKRIGINGVNRILHFFGIDSISKLKNNLKKSEDQIEGFYDRTIDLYKRIELGQLSKGEKQIFILSLYYAIIKVSGKDIPFIIDTPYARIDTEHREQISKEFFPNISNQVIILSTDEEITKHYYDVLKPFISKEYLLQYDEDESRTIVSDGYFFKG